MLSNKNFLVCFRAQQGTKYSLVQLTANCITALRCLQHYIKLRISSLHRGHISTFINAPFIQNSNRIASSVDCNHKFSKCLSRLQLLQYSRQCASFSAHRAALMRKMEFTFPAFSLRFVDFAVKFCFHSKFSVSFHDKRPLHSSNRGMTFLDQPIVSFCIDNRLRQMAFFLFIKVDKGRLLSYGERFEITKSFSCSSLFLSYLKQIVSMFLCLCSVIDHRRHQNVVRASVTLSAITLCTTILFLPYFDVMCDLLLNRYTAA